MVDWAPQNDVLGCPAVKALITNAGKNSLYEAAYHGKPLVAVPLSGDQTDNAAKVRSDSASDVVAAFALLYILSVTRIETDSSWDTAVLRQSIRLRHD